MYFQILTSVGVHAGVVEILDIHEMNVSSIGLRGATIRKTGSQKLNLQCNRGL
jgi:hypothetical protein